MVARRRARRAAAAALGVPLLAGALLAASVRPAAAHPLHTSLAELTYDPSARALVISLRLFADDFSAAVARDAGGRVGAGGVPPDTAMFRYVVQRFGITDRGGRVVPLRWCGTRRAGDMLFLCLRAPAAAPLVGARVRSALLAERFPDQVNIVQAGYGGRRQTLLFTRGDGEKVLE